MPVVVLVRRAGLMLPRPMDVAAQHLSCLFEAKFLKETLGGWDTAKFAAGSEMIKRAKLAIAKPIPF
jgi:hypothetical protein